jgi:hypothetical protein
MNLKLCIVAAAAALLAGCATPTPYGPAARPDGPGFTQTQIESDRFRVTFRGYGGDDGARVQNFALLRAAEITLANNGDYFLVDARDMFFTGRSTGSTLSLGVGGASFGRRSAVGVGVGGGIPLGDSNAEQVATLDFRIGRGPKPPAGNAYDAREVQRSIGYGRPPGGAT